MQALGAVVPSTQSVDSSRSRRARSRGAAITSGVRAALRLYDMPVSNHSARVRIVASWKGLLADGSVEQVSPSELGGTKSEQFLAINPQGKIPVLHDPDSNLSVPESDVIVQYLLHRFSDRSPSLVPSDSVEFSRAHLLARTHDYYISGATQSAIYRKVEKSERSYRLGELARQLDIIADIVSKSDGPWAVGSEPSFADATLLPTFTFMKYLLPKYFGWEEVFEKRGRLQALWDRWMSDEMCKAVSDEVHGALQKWENDGRFENVGITTDVADKSYTWAH